MEKKKTREVAIKKGTYDITTPSQMSSMAVVLKKYIIAQKLSTNIMGHDYAHVEGWQFAGGLLGTFPRITKVTNLSTGTEKKWMAEADLIRMKDNVVVGYGVAICSNLEVKKKSFDEYAVLSMAQTRAIGKAYRNLIGYVMKLAGFEATPKEDMINAGGQVVNNAGYENKSYNNTVPPNTSFKKDKIVVDTGLNQDYAKKLREQVKKMAKKDKMSNMEVLAFINNKLKINPPITGIKSKAAAQMLLSRLN